MYNYFTAAVTAGVMTFVVIYNTGFIQVVTLGGTVLGTACIGIFSALGAELLQNVQKKVWRLILEMLFNWFVLAAVIYFFPGWNRTCSGGSLLFTLCLCAGLTGICEMVLGAPCEKRKHRNGRK